MRLPRRITTRERARPSDRTIEVMCRLGLGSLPEPELLGATFHEILVHRETTVRHVLLGSFLGGLGPLAPSPAHYAAVVRAAFSLDAHDPSARMTVALPPGERLIGVAGSGKEHSGTIHTTVASAIVAASLGVHVVCSGPTAGITDVLDELGMNTDVPILRTVQLLRTTRFGFFANERVVPRLEAVLGGRFPMPSLLGVALPALVCPVDTHALVYGVTQPDVVLSLEVLQEMGVDDAHVATTRIGTAALLDEIGVFGETRLATMDHGQIHPPEIFRPAELFSLPPYDTDDVGESVTQSDTARRIVSALRGRGSPGVLDVICANAANILCAARKAEDLREGFEQARRAIDDDLPLQKLEEIVTASGASPRTLRRCLDELAEGFASNAAE